MYGTGYKQKFQGTTPATSNDLICNAEARGVDPGGNKCGHYLSRLLAKLKSENGTCLYPASIII